MQTLLCLEIDNSYRMGSILNLIIIVNNNYAFGDFIFLPGFLDTFSLV